MTTIGAPSAPLAVVGRRSSAVAGALVSTGVIVILVALALLPLLTPWAMHPALDAARSADWLGVSRATAHALSDQTVAQLVIGPGTFAIAGPDGQPLFDPAEVSHMRDARTLLLLLFGVAAIAVVGIAARLVAGGDRRATWRAIGRGGAVASIGVVVIGVVGLFAFEPLFELFHRVFFPGGNWAFDPRTERLVQLYPFAFWELASAGLGALVLALGLVTWLMGRVLGRSG